MYKYALVGELRVNRYGAVITAIISLVFITMAIIVIVQRSPVVIEEYEKPANLSVRLAHQAPAGDTLFFEAWDNEKNKALASFSYQPGTGKTPVSRELPDGNIILGKDRLFLPRSHELLFLLPLLNCDLIDYDVYGDKIALACKTKTCADVSIYIRDISDDQFLLVDSFQCGPFFKNLYVSWGKNGLLYYDYVLEKQGFIKSYDINTGQEAIFMADTQNPHVSPCGRYMAVKDDQGCSLLKLSDKSRTARLEPYSRLFWEKDCLAAWNRDSGLLQIYCLAECGAMLQEIDLAGNYPLGMRLTDRSVSVKLYQPRNNQIITQDYAKLFSH